MSLSEGTETAVSESFFLREVKGTFFASVTIVFRAFYIITSYYLIHYLNASVSQVFFSGEFGSFLLFIIFILSVKSLRIRLNHFIQSVLAYNIQNIKQLKIVFFRGMLSNFSGLFLVISTLFLTSGDVSSLFAISKVLSGFIFSHFILKQTPSKLSFFIILPLSIIGVILICQPTFIFNENEYNISYLGVIFILVSGILRTSSNLVVSDYSNIDWVIVNGVTLIIGSLLGFSVLIFEILYYSKNILNNNNNLMYYLVMLIICMSQLVIIISSTLSYKLGNFVRLVIFISTIDILLCYLLQYLFFNEILNYITVSGIICVIISVIIINFEIYKLKMD